MMPFLFIHTLIMIIILEILMLLNEFFHFIYVLLLFFFFLELVMFGFFNAIQILLVLSFLIIAFNFDFIFWSNYTLLMFLNVIFLELIDILSFYFIFPMLRFVIPYYRTLLLILTRYKSNFFRFFRWTYLSYSLIRINWFDTTIKFLLI